MAIGLMSLLSGCTAHDELPIGSVRGTVQFDGKPLGAANVTFTPDRGRSATAQTNSDGSFTLTTYREGDGAIVGRHAVAVTARQPGSENQPGAPGMKIPGRSLIPEAYGNAATSGLSFEVVASKQNVFDIRLSSVGQK